MCVYSKPQDLTRLPAHDDASDGSEIVGDFGESEGDGRPHEEIDEEPNSRTLHEGLQDMLAL